MTFLDEREITLDRDLTEKEQFLIQETISQVNQTLESVVASIVDKILAAKEADKAQNEPTKAVVAQEETDAAVAARAAKAEKKAKKATEKPAAKSTAKKDK